MKHAAMAPSPPLHFTSLADPRMVGNVVDAFVVAACKLGYEVSHAHAALRPDAINVVCFGHSVKPEALQGMEGQCILLNFEPLVDGSLAWRESYLALLRTHYVWDYSQRNLARHAELGITHSDYVPLGYEAEAGHDLRPEDVLPEAKQDIDVLFVGSLNSRRARVVDAMRQKGLHVVCNGNAPWESAHRDEMIRRAKLVLNMHFFHDSRIVEIARLALLFRQRKAVLCELYPDSELCYPELRQAIAGAGCEDLADMAMLLMGAPQLRRRLAQEGFEAFSARSQTAVLGPALEAFFAWRARRLGIEGVPSCRTGPAITR
ncbi:MULTISPECIES: hypothetical protein [unclassified Variovorax]|uniref:hypothetical protein n=1 Tax=unclassified Variovorax TaxID=663243 RepID=UPI002577B123|nr:MULTISPECIES: hypothetical protein [unclassified Variovorax]MDM0087092.1 hypothetical protein [Variovorax sp. J22G40]MDM0144651.1 hypothetical protein [Variovorax sp. J2P1-31]